MYGWIIIATSLSINLFAITLDRFFARDILFSFVTFPPLLLVFLYIYISLHQKLQQRFTASRFNFTFISANPFLPNPKKRAFFQRSSVTFQLTPVGRVGKFRLWNTRRGTTRGGTLVLVPCHTSSTRTDNFVHPCKAIEPNQRRVKAAPKPFRDRVVPPRR